MRSTVKCLLASAILAMALAAADAGPRAGAPATALEPAAGLGLGAKLISLAPGNGTHRALIEISLFSPTGLSSLHLDRRDLAKPSTPTEIDLPGSERALRAWEARSVQILLDLEDGRVHHIGLSAEAEDGSGKTIRGSSYLRINLDPALRPEEIDLEDEALIQYRAGAGGM